MGASAQIDEAVAALKTILRRVQSGGELTLEIQAILGARDEVQARYQEIFASERILQLTEEEFRGFLMFRNNKHWLSLQRMGPAICADMDRLRKGLAILLDDGRPIRDRLNFLVPVRGPAYVPRLSKAVLTPILLIVHPDRYGVWNQISEAAMKILGLWPEFERGTPFGERYEVVNEVMNDVAQAIGVDLWTLDALWWRASQLLGDPDAGSDGDPQLGDVEGDAECASARFGLERHLQEFLRDNWDQTPLGPEWTIYEEDGDPEAGYEYP